MNSKSQRITHLDGLRGFAILLVIFFHAYARWPQYLSFVSDTKDIFIFKYGYLGVQLFFMISGFVIFMSLDKSNNAIDFMRKRWLRLFPAMLVVSLIIYATAPFFHERPAGLPELKDVIPGLTFVNPRTISFLLGEKVNGLEGAFWSLYVEMMFYIFSCFFYFSLGRNVILRTIFIAFFISFLLLVIERPLGIDFYATKDYLKLIGFVHYGWFFIGCFAYEKVNERVNFLDKVMLLIVFICYIYLYAQDIYKLLMMLFIISLFYYSSYSNLVKNFLNSKVLLFFGLVSYPLYLIHENMMVSSTVKLLNSNLITPYVTPLISLAFITVFSYFIVKLEPVLKTVIVRSSIKLKTTANY